MTDHVTDTIIDEINGIDGKLQGIAAGNDLVHLPTFVQSCTPYFIRRGYTQNEIDYCEQFSDKILRYASTWAAKEAIYKAMKQVDENLKLWWRDIEIHRNKPQGKPLVSIKKVIPSRQVSLTITHDGEYVWALALCKF